MKEQGLPDQTSSRRAELERSKISEYGDLYFSPSFNFHQALTASVSRGRNSCLDN